MNPQKAIKQIQSKFSGVGSTEQIPLMNGKSYFKATLKHDGVEVDNLGTQKFLPWKVFEETVRLLSTAPDGKRRQKGNSHNGKLGDKLLPLDSIEGHIAAKVYGKPEGKSVFRRISPVAALLSWASICDNGRGYLSLRP